MDEQSTGRLRYFASTYADGGEVLWLLERCKIKLLKVSDRDE